MKLWTIEPAITDAEIDYGRSSGGKRSTLRIAFLTTEFVTEASFDGGAAQYLGRVVRALRLAGHDPEVFVSSDRDETIFWESSPVHRAKIPRRRIDQIVKVTSRLLRRRCAGTIEKLGTAWVLARRLRRRNRERPFDIAQATNLSMDGLFVNTLGRRIPLVVRLSGDQAQLYDLYEVPRTADRMLAERIGRHAICRADGVYTPSKTLARWMSDRYGIAADVVPPIFELPRYDEATVALGEIGENVEYVLFFGTVGRLKGMNVLTTAMQEVFALNPTIHLVIAGKDATMGTNNGTGIEWLKRGLSRFVERVHILGKLPPEKLYPVIRLARIVVLPSRTDNLPNACLEAMALGRVVIGTRGASFDELIDDGVSGFLVDREDPAALASSIRVALELHEPARERIGQMARQTVEAFKAANVVPLLESYYRSKMA